MNPHRAHLSKAVVKPMTDTITRTLRFKVKTDSYGWLNKAAVEVNAVWNWANETSAKAARPYYGPPKWLSGFDLNKLSAGATRHFAHIGSGTIQCINAEYATRRSQFKKRKLRWRVSSGPRRRLGWVPFKAASIKVKGNALRFCGKTIRVFESDRLQGYEFRQGSFSQNALGEWFFNVVVMIPAVKGKALDTQVGVDLGLKTIATTTEPRMRLDGGRFYRDIEHKIANAQRRGHKRQAKYVHRKAVNRRKDALHKFSRELVDAYGYIVIGDVSSAKLVKTRMAKSALDSGWGMLKQFIQYKGADAGRTVEVVNEAYTSRACSSCGSLTGPKGLNELRVREWSCRNCGELHDRDINAAQNILRLGARYSPPFAGTSRTNKRRPKRRGVV